MTRSFRFLLLTAVLAGIASPAAYAWGRDGHRIVGTLAMELLDPVATEKLEEIIGSTGRRAMDSACNWPDRIRGDPQYESTAPWHYVNLPRWDDHYVRERDCRSGDCVTESLKRFVTRLHDERLPRQARKEAFNWICHQVGDLHQPLHAGYRDDRGGNTLTVELRGRKLNLHQLWDTRLIRTYRPSWRRYANRLSKRLNADAVEPAWSPDAVDRWTEESHRLVRTQVYPRGEVIRSSYADQAMELIDQRLIVAATRLAQILNAALGRGRIEASGENQPKK